MLAVVVIRNRICMYIVFIHNNFYLLAQKRAGSSGSQENFRHSYANNFGAGFGKSGLKDAEGLVVSSSFKSVVSRLVLTRKELKSQENLVSNI